MRGGGLNRQVVERGFDEINAANLDDLNAGMDTVHLSKRESMSASFKHPKSLPSTRDGGGECRMTTRACADQDCQQCGVDARWRPCMNELGDEPVMVWKYVEKSRDGKYKQSKLVQIETTRNEMMLDLREHIKKFVVHYRACLLDSWDMKL